jgi:NADH-quinone oxidoreductase subunit A
VLAEYLPTLLFLIVATGIGIALMVVGNVLGPKRPSAEKLSVRMRLRARSKTRA